MWLVRWAGLGWAGQGCGSHCSIFRVPWMLRLLQLLGPAKEEAGGAEGRATWRHPGVTWLRYQPPCSRPM